jgi:hypothetical protein
VPGREQSAGYLPGPPAPREGSVRGAVSCEASRDSRSRRPCEEGSRRGSAGNRRSQAGRRDGPIMSWAGWKRGAEMGGNGCAFQLFLQLSKQAKPADGSLLISREVSLN